MTYPDERLDASRAYTLLRRRPTHAVQSADEVMPSTAERFRGCMRMDLFDRVEAVHLRRPS